MRSASERTLLQQQQRSATATLGQSAVLTAVAVLCVAVDMLVLVDGFSLLNSHFSASDLARSEMSQGTVTLHGRALITLGLLPVTGLLVTVAIRVLSMRLQRKDGEAVGRRARLARIALIATCAAQGVAVLAAAASTL